MTTIDSILLDTKKHYSCSCKGIRTCAICLSEGKPDVIQRQNQPNKKILNFDKKLQAELEPEVIIIRNFVNKEEEKILINHFQTDPLNSQFKDSQSGRRKIDYGVKVNFKKQKVKIPADFEGFPKFTKEIIFDKFNDPEIINQLQEHYTPHELLILDYHPDRGSHIDAHIDDTWAWGKTIMNLNLMSETVLTLENDEFILPIKLFPGDLLALRGQARNVWTHEILKEHITSQRYCVTLRDLSDAVKIKYPEIWGRFKDGPFYFDI